jgi:hypothetical protein
MLQTRPEQSSLCTALDSSILVSAELFASPYLGCFLNRGRSEQRTLTPDGGFREV